MPIVSARNKVLFLPVIRGIYPAGMTARVTAVVKDVAAGLGIDAIFPADGAYTDGLIKTDDDTANYAAAWLPQLARIKALVVISSDFMRERVVQDTARLLPDDVPVFMMVNNDAPAELVDGKVGDSFCGSLSVHHAIRMLGRRIVRSCRTDMHDRAGVESLLSRFRKIIDGIEGLRNTRVAMLGINPGEFTTTYTNQIKLFECGFSLHSYELITLWGDTVLASLVDEGSKSCRGPFGDVKFWRPVRRNDARIPAVKDDIRKLLPGLSAGEAKVDTLARCFLWVQDTFAAERIDTGAVHCWPEFTRYFGFAPCTLAMLSNHLLRKPLACECDICHAIMMKLAWEMTGEAGVVLDLNNNGWEPRVFNAFHCSQTPPNWLTGPVDACDGGQVLGQIAPAAFTGISAATTAGGFKATVFHGRMLRRASSPRGSSGWAFVPNLPSVLESIQECGIHHYVALKGHIGCEVADALAFRGIEPVDLSQPVPPLEDVEAEVFRNAAIPFTGTVS
ncbi:hypothetical protein GX586_03915 [bacterium]|nr:hypothetical protein [bacterium]